MEILTSLLGSKFLQACIYFVNLQLTKFWRVIAAAARMVTFSCDRKPNAVLGWDRKFTLYIRILGKVHSLVEYTNIHPVTVCQCSYNIWRLFPSMIVDLGLLFHCG